VTWVWLPVLTLLLVSLFYRRTRNFEVNALFDTAIDGLVICRYDGGLVRANPYFYKLLGYSEKAILGKNILDFIHPDDRDSTIRELAHLEGGGSVNDYTNRYVTRANETVHLVWSATSDTKTRLIFASARNITEKIRHEEQLRAVAYMASHDFAEPVRAIAQFSSLLLDKEGDRLSEKGRRWLSSNIMESSKRLRNLSDDLRDYLRSMREEPVLEPIDLNEATLAAIELLNGAVEEAGATISYSGLPTVWGTKQLSSVLYNLLSNAIKYVGEGVHPSIHLSCVDDGDTVTVSVLDNGIGFDPKYAKAIFDLGRRLFSADSKYWGSGAGLAIVKLQVERMGGTVWATSTPGSGSVFSFRLRKA